jgi:hypothetical protein
MPEFKAYSDISIRKQSPPAEVYGVKFFVIAVPVLLDKLVKVIKLE